MYKKYARQMLKNTYLYFLKILTYHCGFRVPGSQPNIYENFANYFLNTKSNNNCFTVVKCTCKGHEKQKRVKAVKSKPMALRCDTTG